LIQSPELRNELVQDLLDGLEHPAAESLALRCIHDRRIAIAPGEEHVGQDVADVVAHRAVKGKLRVKDKGMRIVDEDGACVQVAVNQRLRVVHEFKFQLGRLEMQGLVPIDLLLHKVGIRREYVVALGTVVVGLSVDEVLGQVTEVWVNETLDELLLLLMVHDDIRREQQCPRHERRDVLRKMRIDMMFEQPRTHHRMADHVLHRDGTHRAVVKVDMRNEPRCQLSLDGQDLGLNAAAVSRQVHVLRDAQLHARLLDDDGLARLRITDPEDVTYLVIITTM